MVAPSVMATGLAEDARVTVFMHVLFAKMFEDRMDLLDLRKCHNTLLDCIAMCLESSVKKLRAACKSRAVKTRDTCMTMVSSRDCLHTFLEREAQGSHGVRWQIWKAAWQKSEPWTWSMYAVWRHDKKTSQVRPRCW